MFEYIMVYPSPVYYTGFDKASALANSWADDKWDSHIALPMAIKNNQTRYMQKCSELDDRSLSAESQWSVPEYDVSCQRRSSIPATKESIFQGTTVVKLDWAVQELSPDCTFSHFRVTYQIRSSTWETVDAGFRPHYRLGDGL
jgi:hypothetical protein